MKIFLGTAEIAGMNHFLAHAFQASGHQVTTCVDNAGSGFFNFEYDIVLNLPAPRPSKNPVVRKAREIRHRLKLDSRRRKVFEQESDKHDLYVFIWNGFLPNSIKDYQLIKQRGKKIVSIFLGSDVRHVSAFVQEYGLDVSTWEQWFHTTDLNKQLFRLRKAELYSDVIYSLPDQAGLAIRPFNKVYIPFKVDSFQFNIPARARPRIVHIPSRTGIKGTDFIVKVIEDLRGEGHQFDFEIITGVPNSTVHQALYDADILIDEIFLHGPGTLSLEGIASGCAVATKTIEGERYSELICNIGFDNLKEKLLRLINDVEYRVQLAHRAVDGIKLLNDPVRIANDIVHQAQQANHSQRFDYYPRFYSDAYTLPPGSRIDRRNISLTRTVVDKFNLQSSLDIQRMKAEKLI